MSTLQTFWAKLQGSVHPDDQQIFAEYPEHSFNLQYPPPAFVGDPDAPIIILMSNGGYKQGVTEAEFPDDAAVTEFREYIRGETRTLPSRLASYYARGQVGRWISDGKAARVNAVPYRSPQLSSEPLNQKVAEKLAARAVHRRWLMDEVVPEATQGRRFIFVHRNRWWDVPRSVAGPCILFSDPLRAEPNRSAPDQEKLDQAELWLRRGGGKN